MTGLRKKFEEELDDASDLLVASKYAIGLTGAGISVESGIPPSARASEKSCEAEL